MNAESKAPREPSFHELALQTKKRPRLTAKKVRRFGDAERRIQEAHPEEEAVQDKRGGTTRRSRDTWRGARCGDRRFHSLQMEPLTSEKGRGQKASGAARAADEGGVLGRVKGGGWSLFLFGIGIAALVALLLILSNYYGRLRTLDGKTTATAPQSAGVSVGATETSTPVPSATPSPGHRDTPTRVETAYQKGAPAPAPSSEPPLEPTLEAPTPLPGASIPERLVIPSIGVDAPVVQGDGQEDLERGVGHRVGSANPGARGNVVLSAHNDIHDEIFRDLQRLEVGADIYIHTDERVYHYLVQSVKIVAPTKVEVMEATDDARLTLITCHPYMLDTHRVVAVARLVE